MPYCSPRIATLNASLLPAAPAGCKFINLTDPDKLDNDSKLYPVLLFGSYTYTALSKTDNAYSMVIVAWDMQRNLVKRLDKPGARYIWQITFDSEKQTVAFTGQSRTSVYATLDELIVGPSVVRLSPSSGPVLPSTLDYISTDSFPVIKSGPYSFWPVSYKDGRNSFSMVVVSEDNTIQKLIDCPGGRGIEDILVDHDRRTIVLKGQNGSEAIFDYDTALACYHSCYVFTKQDFLFLAEYFKVPLSDDDAAALTFTLDCTTCCPMMGTYSEESKRDKRAAGFYVGAFLGGVAGAIGGFLIGGPGTAVLSGLALGAAVGAAVGDTVPDKDDLGSYQLSSLEKDYSLVGYNAFPCGPFDNTGVRENLFDSPFPRYGELPYSAAMTKPNGASSPQAYSPAAKAIGELPRDPRYNTRPLQNGDQITKYIFVIVKTDDTVDGKPGYQMRINPEDFYPDSWPASQRVNHSQMSEGYRFWALVGNPHMQVYGAGSLYVNITSGEFLGIDSRTGHYFLSFRGHDQAVMDAALGFLTYLGYPTSGMAIGADVQMRLQGDWR